MWTLQGFPQLLLILAVVVTGAIAGDDHGQPKVFQPMSWMPPVRACPETCEALFLNLQEGAEGQGKVQHVDMQQRGERESGTSFMFAWATDILGQSCMYFQRAYGRMSCRVEFTDHTRTLIFEPGLGKADEEKPPQCPCDTISIVTINISSENKHLLPCDGSCPWSRGAGVARPAEPVRTMLAILCKWTTVRYKLFAETLAAQSTVYWYSDTLVAPLPWHYNLLWYFGLSMPAAVVEWSSHVASKGSPCLYRRT